MAPVNSGDLQGAAIEANAKAADNVVAAVDAVREYNDQAAEIQGRAINAAEDNAWQAVNAAQEAAAKIDGAAASVSPDAARAVAGSAVVAPIAAYSAPAVVAPAISAYSSPLIAGPSFAYQRFGSPILPYGARGFIQY